MNHFYGDEYTGLRDDADPELDRRNTNGPPHEPALVRSTSRMQHYELIVRHRDGRLETVRPWMPKGWEVPIGNTTMYGMQGAEILSGREI